MTGMPEEYENMARLNPKMNYWKAVQQLVATNTAGQKSRLFTRKIRNLEDIYKKYAEIIAFIKEHGLKNSMHPRDEASKMFPPSAFETIKKIRKDYRKEKKLDKKKSEGGVTINSHSHTHPSGAASHANGQQHQNTPTIVVNVGTMGNKTKILPPKVAMEKLEI